MALIIPANYDPHLTVRETQEAIKYIRDTFQKEFGKEMHLERISAPLFVTQSSGLNDNLNGVERPVQFDIAGKIDEELEQGTKAIESLGGSIADVIRFELTGAEADRSLVVIDKIVKTAKKYPRKAGVPSKEPIGK